MAIKDDILHPEGLFNPAFRFAFTNITEEDFTSYWGGKPITIKPKQTVKLRHHLAVKFLKELVDKIMQGEAKLDEVNFYKSNPNSAPNSYRSPKGLSLGVPAARKVYEDQIIKQLPSEEEGVEFEILKSEFREQLERDLSQQVSTAPVSVPAAQLSGTNNKLPSEFAEVTR